MLSVGRENGPEQYQHSISKCLHAGENFALVLGESYLTYTLKCHYIRQQIKEKFSNSLNILAKINYLHYHSSRLNTLLLVKCGKILFLFSNSEVHNDKTSKVNCCHLWWVQESHWKMDNWLKKICLPALVLPSLLLKIFTISQALDWKFTSFQHPLLKFTYTWVVNGCWKQTF